MHLFTSIEVPVVVNMSYRDEFSSVRNPFNLQTYQRRLRHLQSIAVRNLQCPKNEDIEFSSLQVFFTLHKDDKSPAFYTSEKITGSLNPTWQSFDPHQFESKVSLTSKFFVVRIWMTQGQEAKVKIESQVHLSGLVYFADKLQVAGVKHSTNTMLFGLRNHIFFHYSSASATPQLDNWVPDKDIPRDRLPSVVLVDQSLLKPSYNLNSLSRIHTVRRAIIQTQASVKRVHSNIEDRLLSSTENSQRLSDREVYVMKVRQLRHELLQQTQLRQNEQEQLEKFKNDLEARAEKLKCCRKDLQSQANKTEDNRTMHIQSREMLVKENAHVAYRRKQIINEMAHYIYPITEDEKHNFYICKVRLPNAEDYQGQDEVRVAVALGLTCHLTQMLSHFMDMPLRYPMVHRGSRSIIIDHVHSKLTEKDREFPLFSKGKEKFQFNYAVFLLNKNISQLRFYCGLGTHDLRQTLPNLKFFLEQRLGVRTLGASDQKRASGAFFQSPMTTSVGGSRQSQAPSSPTSSIVRKDLISEKASSIPDSGTSSLQGGTALAGKAYSSSVASEGISLADLESNGVASATPPAKPKLNYSMSLPAGGTSSQNSQNGHSQSSGTQHPGNGDSKHLAKPRSKTITEEEEAEDLFKPSDDTFFKVQNVASSSPFSQAIKGTPSSGYAFIGEVLSLDSGVSPNGAIPTSDILNDDSQRTFKLFKAQGSTSSGGAASSLGTHAEESSTTEGQEASLFPSSMSYDDSDLYETTESKDPLTTMER